MTNDEGHDVARCDNPICAWCAGYFSGYDAGNNIPSKVMIRPKITFAK